ncbi:MAG: hypothetical protein ACE5FJ_03195, partial [Gemmatimonadales bacterium]
YAALYACALAIEIADRNNAECECPTPLAECVKDLLAETLAEMGMRGNIFCKEDSEVTVISIRTKA